MVMNRSSEQERFRCIELQGRAQWGVSRKGGVSAGLRSQTGSAGETDQTVVRLDYQH